MLECWTTSWVLRCSKSEPPCAYATPSWIQLCTRCTCLDLDVSLNRPSRSSAARYIPPVIPIRSDEFYWLILRPLVDILKLRHGAESFMYHIILVYENSCCSIIGLFRLYHNGSIYLCIVGIPTFTYLHTLVFANVNLN